LYALHFAAECEKKTVKKFTFIDINTVHIVLDAGYRLCLNETTTQEKTYSPICISCEQFFTGGVSGMTGQEMAVHGNMLKD